MVKTADAFAYLPVELKDVIKDHKRGINAGLHYVACGHRAEPVVLGTERCNVRIALSPRGSAALDALLKEGFTRREAFVQAVLLIREHPTLKKVEA